MINLNSKNGNQYHLLDYNNLNERGLTPLKKAIERSGVEIAKIIQAGTARRKDGVAMRTFGLKVMDEQEVTVQVNDTGDVSAISLNKKAVPYTGARNLSELAKVIADAIKANANTFAKSLERKLARAAKPQDGQSKKPAVKSNAQRLAEQNARIDAAKANIQTVQQFYAEREQAATSTRTKMETAKTELKSEQARNRQLKGELEQLQGQKDDD
ncbi:hypothetical protein O3W44_22140 [Pantoea sp. LMR881]|uniref:defense against restriction DarA-related protein n=1 Tax=Pantoea sp. LMR881 TaxID=3014336 RepID=UPI0022AEF6B3|nr:hypothetical protein [Pantoea sp. LMR881]MCZ4061233.1 hypothetical protein [Pantoea sp. LMR881]